MAPPSSVLRRGVQAPSPSLRRAYRHRHQEDAEYGGVKRWKIADRVLGGIRDLNIKPPRSSAPMRPTAKTPDDFDAIGVALAERRVGALFLVKGKILPGSRHQHRHRHLRRELTVTTEAATSTRKPRPTSPTPSPGRHRPARRHPSFEQDQMPTDQPSPPSSATRK